MSDTPKVISLFPGQPTAVPADQAAIDPEIDAARVGMVEALEELLEMAKAGQLDGFAYATLDAAGAITTGWGGIRRVTLGGAVLALSTRYGLALSGVAEA